MKTIAIKDNICVKGEAATCGMKMLENFIPPYNATVVDRLNANEFTVTRESADLMLSSSTGEHSSPLQGIMLKPTRGAVSRYGLITATPSLEEITIIGKTVNDVEELFNIVRGVDEKDSTTVAGKNVDIPANIKIGELHEIEYASTAHKIIACGETFSNLAKFDGMKFGYRSENAETLTELYENTRAEGFDYDTKLKILLGGVVLGREYRHLYYDRAVRARAKICEDVNAVLETCDVIVTPLGGNYAVIPNLTGLPAIVVGDKQIIGRKFSEELLLMVAKTMENGGANNA